MYIQTRLFLYKNVHISLKSHIITRILNYNCKNTHMHKVILVYISHFLLKKGLIKVYTMKDIKHENDSPYAVF